MSSNTPRQAGREPGSFFRLGLIGTVTMVLLGTGGYLYLRQANHNSALSAVKEWARINEFPTAAKNLTVVTEGGMFSREFTVEFDAPVEAIQRWLNESPGTKDSTPTIDGNVYKYSITPGGGASHAELEFDRKSGYVRINAYWS